MSFPQAYKANTVPTWLLLGAVALSAVLVYVLLPSLGLGALVVPAAGLGLLGWVWYSCPDVTVTVTPQEFTVKHESGCGGSQTAVYRWTDVTATHYWEEVTGEPGSDARAAPKGAAYFRVDTTAGPAFQMRCAGRTAEVIVAFNELVPSLPYVWQRPGTAGSGRATFSTTRRFTTSSARSGEYVKVQRGAGYALNALA